MILKMINGSKLYGLDHADSDDDYVGVFVEDPDVVFMGHSKKTTSLRETPDGVRNGAGDVDGVAYSVRHFFHLALKGNPTIITLLFVPNHAIVESTEIGRSILSHRDYFVSSKVAAPFRGYMKAQLERLKGQRTGHKPNRPEIVAEHGYDTKYAQQVARLGIQGRELMEFEKISLPMRQSERDLCMRIRNGHYTLEDVLIILENIAEDLFRASLKTNLPPEPNEKAVAKLSRQIHERYWQ